jgi:phytanoyl-CoA hydroxylase
MGALTQAERDHFDVHGFVRLPGFADATTCQAMLDDVIAVTRAQANGTPEPEALVLPEANLVGRDGSPEDLASKVFKLHRRGVFEAFSRRDDVIDRVADLVGPQLDCFLSQFIFKNPGAWGQPWHQDSWYFPFEPARPITGVWLAVTQATLENGCLHVLPGSHREPVHEHVPDRRPDANYGYVEIIDHNMSGSTPVLMDPGDLLLFDSHLMHCSTDNESDGVRAAMVYHYCATGTVERTKGLVNDFVTVRP